MEPRVPRLVSGVDVFALPLSTMEGFVLSRVDGASAVEDISVMSGIALVELLRILERLNELGAVECAWVAAKVSPVQDTRQWQADYDPRELEADADIDAATRKRILDAFYTLDQKNHYQVLGVLPEADRKQIRSAYFELSKVFHPDAFFGKELGLYKARMETVFKRLTEAYEILGRNKRRAEYDEYLATTEQTRSVDATLAKGRRRADTLRRSQFPVVEEVVKPGADRRQAPAAVPSVQPEAAASSLVPEPSTQTPGKPSTRRPVSTAERRQRIRARLRRGLKSVPPPAPGADDTDATKAPPDAVVPPSPERRDGVIKDLARSLKQSSDMTGSDLATDANVGRYLRQAKEAEAAGDLLGAANALQLGLALDPEHPSLGKEYARVSAEVAGSLAANYEKQAEYEEKRGKWEAAARSWARVVEGRPSLASPSRRLAQALLKADGDLHRARKYAESAVELEPSDVANRTVLARVFLAAGMKLNAKRELEKAVKLDPKDEMVKNLLREVR